MKKGILLPKFLSQGNENDYWLACLWVLPYSKAKNFNSKWSSYTVLFKVMVSTWDKKKSVGGDNPSKITAANL